jgi:hypothetical protein
VTAERIVTPDSAEMDADLHKALDEAFDWYSAMTGRILDGLDLPDLASKFVSRLRAYGFEVAKRDVDNNKTRGKVLRAKDHRGALATRGGKGKGR